MNGASMDDAFVRTLVDRLSDKNGQIRERARYTLVLIGSPAVPSLLELTSSRDKRTRWEAAKTLAAIADPRSMPAQLALLSDPESDIRWIAAKGLIKLGPQVLVDVLGAIINEPDSKNLRRSVHHVLRELAGENPVVKELVDPVLDVLGETSPPSTIPPAADEARKEIEGLQNGTPIDWQL